MDKLRAAVKYLLSAMLTVSIILVLYSFLYLSFSGDFYIFTENGENMLKLDKNYNIFYIK